MSTSRHSLSERYELFVAAGTLAAHVTHLEEGFRQREAKFFTELFSNWMDVTLHSSVLELKNTQVKRYLENLTELGYAKQKQRRKPPSYSLTKGGVIELLERLRQTEIWPHPGHFFFIYFFLQAYGPVMLELLDAGSPPLPPQFRLQLAQLLDPELLKQEQIVKIKQRILELRERLHRAPRSVSYARSTLAKSLPIAQVFLELEKKHPYQLNSQRPLGDLLNSLSESQAVWEITTGTELRAQSMWGPLEQLMNHYLHIISSLRN